MKKIGFIGAYDKTDFIIYIARILVALGNKVMVIDSTLNQKAKYIVPVINPTKEYVTDFEGIDVAVGFDNFESIKDYLGMPQSAVFDYDYMLIDTDSARVLETFGMREADRNFCNIYGFVFDQERIRNFEWNSRNITLNENLFLEV